jgi:hypothetical protein
VFDPAIALSPMGAMLADLTGDGRADAAVSSSGIGQLGILPLYASNGTTLDGAPFLTLTVPGVTDMAIGAEEIADFNGDGLQDIVARTFPQNAASWLFSGVAPGCATLTPRTLPFTGTFTVRAGDVNRDGFDDLIGVVPGQVQVFFGGPQGLGVAPDQTIAVPQ